MEIWLGELFILFDWLIIIRVWELYKDSFKLLLKNQIYIKAYFIIKNKLIIQDKVW